VGSQLVVQNQGYVSNPSPFITPPGTLYEAKNVSLDRPGRVVTRRGFNRYGTQLPFTGVETFNKFFNYDGNILLHGGTTMYYDSDDAGTWTAYTGTFSPQGDKIRGIESSGSFFFNPTIGVQKIDELTATPYNAGIPKALGGTAILGAGATWFITANQVAYRIVWGRTDVNSVTNLGTPSQRIVLANTSGSTKNVDVTFDVPAGITTDYFYQIYRSSLSGGAAVEPNDELQLVYQAFYVSGTSVTVTDNTPPELLGPYLYTSPSQEGPLQTNDEPPVCGDIDFYKQVAFYANTRRKHYLLSTLLGVGAPNGVQSGDTFTFNNGVTSFTLTAAVAENAAAGQFLVSTLPTPSERVDETARSFVKVLNQYATNTILYGYYLSGYSDLPGKMQFEARTYSGPQFWLTTNTARPDFNPPIPTSGDSLASVDDAFQNRVCMSKFGQVEAVPQYDDTFFLDIGSQNFAIDRIIALRDSVFVFKDDGIFKIIGDLPGTYRVIRFDNSVKLRGFDTPAILDNTIFCVTDQGITSINDNGIIAISSLEGSNIENVILPLFNGLYPGYELSFGLGYSAAKKYILWTVKSTSDTYPTRAYVYHLTSQKFTYWDVSAEIGFVSYGDDKIYLGYPEENYVRQERKTLTSNDYLDNSFNVTISSYSGLDVTLASVTGVTSGMFLSQGNNRAMIDSIAGNVVTVDETITWNLTTAAVSEPILARINYAPLHYGDPSVLKQGNYMRVMFDYTDSNRLNVGFFTDLSPGEEDVTLPGTSNTEWGLPIDLGWGDDPWGGDAFVARVERTAFPREKAWHHWTQVVIENNDILSSFGILGIAIDYEPIGEAIR